MAIIQFAFGGSPSEGSAFTVRLTNVNSDAAANASATYSSGGTTALVDSGGNVLSPTFNFGTETSRVASYSGSNMKYVTFRNDTATSNTLTYSQYPTAGLSFDIFSDALYDQIGNTWTQIISNASGIYSLNTGKYTLVYNYSNTYALYYIKGGNVTISSV
jgi:hypothetical protein